MSTNPRSRPNSSGRSRGSAQLDRHIVGYREYLSERGNAVGYVRNCEAAVVHLSMWMKDANKRLADVDERLVADFLEHHLPGCRCATSASHPSTVRAALGHLLVVLGAANAIPLRPLDMTEVGQELRRYGPVHGAGAGACAEDARGGAAPRRSIAAQTLRRRRHPLGDHHAGACAPLLRRPSQELQDAIRQWPSEGRR